MNETELAIENLSACMDGELSAEQFGQLMQELKSDPVLGRCWNEYHQIGDILRSTDCLPLSERFSKQLGERLADEPFLFASPAPLAAYQGKSASSRPWLAVAASIAVVVGGVYMMLPQRSAEAPQIAQRAVMPEMATRQASSPSTATEPAEVAVRPVSNEFLMAHRNYSAGLAMHGVVSHVRTAGYDGK